jgi:lysophosphatidylcholine acyltransferase/lyso-PAF acetyltransferase
MTIEDLRKARQRPYRPFVDTIIRVLMFLVIGVPRAVLGGAYIFIAAIFFESVVTVWRIFGCPESFRRSIQILWNALARILLAILGIVQINYHEKVDPDARFLVSNHLCFFDRWLFLPLLPRPLDKKEILAFPGIRAAFGVFNGITVDRTRSTGMTKVLIKAASDMTAPVLQVFPEGTQTNGEFLMRFHMGSFLSDLPVQPVAIRYNLWGTSRRFSNISYFHRTWDWMAFLNIPFMTVDVTFLPACSLKAYDEGDPRRFADAVSLAIGECLGIPVMDISSNALFHDKDK